MRNLGFGCAVALCVALGCGDDGSSTGTGGGSGTTSSTGGASTVGTGGANTGGAGVGGTTTSTGGAGTGGAGGAADPHALCLTGKTPVVGCDTAGGNTRCEEYYIDVGGCAAGVELAECPDTHNGDVVLGICDRGNYSVWIYGAADTAQTTIDGAKTGCMSNGGVFCQVAPGT